jgi:hypothetical protein
MAILKPVDLYLCTTPLCVCVSICKVSPVFFSKIYGPKGCLQNGQARQSPQVSLLAILNPLENLSLSVYVYFGMANYGEKCHIIELE